MQSRRKKGNDGSYLNLSFHNTRMNRKRWFLDRNSKFKTQAVLNESSIRGTQFIAIFSFLLSYKILGFSTGMWSIWCNLNAILTSLSLGIALSCIVHVVHSHRHFGIWTTRSKRCRTMNRLLKTGKMNSTDISDKIVQSSKFKKKKNSTLNQHPTTPSFTQ